MTLRRATYPVRLAARLLVAAGILVAAVAILGIMMTVDWLLEDPRPA